MIWLVFVSVLSVICVFLKNTSLKQRRYIYSIIFTLILATNKYTFLSSLSVFLSSVLFISYRHRMRCICEENKRRWVNQLLSDDDIKLIHEDKKWFWIFSIVLTTCSYSVMALNYVINAGALPATRSVDIELKINEIYVCFGLILLIMPAIIYNIIKLPFFDVFGISRNLFSFMLYAPAIWLLVPLVWSITTFDDWLVAILLQMPAVIFNIDYIILPDINSPLNYVSNIDELQYNDFKVLINTDDGFSYILEYLKYEMRQELALCWLSILDKTYLMDWKSMDNFCDKFLEPSSPLYVDLPSTATVRRAYNVYRSIPAIDKCRNVFDDLAEEIISTLQNEIVPRFIHSKIYSNAYVARAPSLT